MKGKPVLVVQMLLRCCLGTGAVNLFITSEVWCASFSWYAEDAQAKAHTKSNSQVSIQKGRNAYFMPGVFRAWRGM